jgi:hypothetical protein
MDFAQNISGLLVANYRGTVSHMVLQTRAMQAVIINNNQ